MTIKYHHRSNKQDWETPWELFDEFNFMFQFTLDVCATAENTKCRSFFTPEQNGLLQPWEGVCWMNPPYGHEIGKWIKKAWDESQKGATVVCLIPSRTDTKWWHEYCMRGYIIFLKGRIRFVNANGPAPFPSAIVIFPPNRQMQPTIKNIAAD